MTEEGRKHGIDAEGLRDVLDVVADQIPNLLRSIREVLYSEEAATDMAEAVATVYTKLVEAGIPKEDALEMARGYMINLKDLMGHGMGKGMQFGGGHGGMQFTHRHGGKVRKINVERHGGKVSEINIDIGGEEIEGEEEEGCC